MTENVKRIGHIYILGISVNSEGKKDICILFPGNGLGCNGWFGWVAFLSCYYSYFKFVFIVIERGPRGNVHIGGVLEYRWTTPCEEGDIMRLYTVRGFLNEATSNHTLYPRLHSQIPRAYVYLTSFLSFFLRHAKEGAINAETLPC